MITLRDEAGFAFISAAWGVDGIIIVFLSLLFSIM